MSHFVSEPQPPTVGPERKNQTRTMLFRAAAARSWPILIALTVLGGLAGAAVGATVSESRTATAVILLNPLDGNPFYPGTRGELLVNLFSEAQVIRSNTVAKTLPDATATGATAEQILTNLSVSVPANTQILQVSYSSADPAVALGRAQGFADAYLAYRKARAAASIASRVDGTKAEIAAHETDLTRLTAQVAAAPIGSATAGLLLTQVQSLATQISQLNARMGDIASTALDPGQVITPAKLQTPDPIGTRGILVVGGALLGLLLGLAIAYLRSGVRSKSVVRTAAQIEAFGIRTLATQPNTVEAAHRTFSGSVPADINSSFLPFGAQILDLTRHHRSKSILIAASRTDAEHPLSVVSMASSLAASGIETIVVDMTGKLVLPLSAGGRSPGLADVLRDGLPIDSALVSVGPSLRVIRAASRTDSVSRVNAAPGLMELIGSLAERADVVLVAAGSMLTPDTQLLASAIKSAVIEIEYGHSRISELSAAVQICNDLSVDLLGAVVLPPHHTDRVHPVPPRKDTEKTIADGGGLDRTAPLISSGSHGD